MSKYTLSVLEKFCIDNNVILLKNYTNEKMGCEVIIECKCFKDGCRNKIQKSFRYLLKNGNLCRNCGNKNRKQTTFQTFTDCVKNNRVRQGIWHNKENHKLYAEWLGKTLGYRTMEDWYKITSNIINENYGSGLIKYYQGSSILFLKSVFPEKEWLEWKFAQTSQGFWHNKENRKLYAIWLGETIGYKNMDYWYQVTVDIISNNYGAGLLYKYYEGSPFLFIKSIFPEKEWLGWKFAAAPYNFWNLETEKQYAIWLGETLGYNCMEDWYGISRKLIIDNFGGGYVLQKYNGSPALFVTSVFPEEEWLEWKFNQTRHGFWYDKENHKLYAEWLGETLEYKNMEDWYKISVIIIKQHYGTTMLFNYYKGSPFLFLKTIFPGHNWIKSKFPKKYSIGQIEWLEYIKITTPGIRHILNCNDGEFNIPRSKYSADGYSLELNCIYEYNGDFWHGNPKIYNETDINPIAKKSYGELYANTIKKQKFCEKQGFKYKSVWESEWLKGKNAVIKIQKRYRNHFL